MTRTRMFAALIAVVLALAPDARAALEDDPLIKKLLEADQTAGFSGTADRVYGMWGKSLQVAQSSKLETAQAFLKLYGAALGFPADLKLSDWKPLEMPGAAASPALFLAPTIGGVPWLGGAIGFAFDAQGNLAGLIGAYRPLLPALPATIDQAQALKLAVQAAREALPKRPVKAGGKVHQFLHVKDGKLAPVFMVEIALDSPGGQWNVFIGPGGEVLQQICGDLSADPEGTVYPTYPDATMATAKHPLPDLLPPPPGEAWRLNGRFFVSRSSNPQVAISADGQFHFPPKRPRDDGSTRPSTDADFDDPRFLETNVYYHLNHARRRALDLGAGNTDNLPINYDVWIPPLDLAGNEAPGAGAAVTELEREINKARTNNAYFSPVEMHIRFAYRNARFDGIHPATDASVIYHEFGHAVQTAMNPLWRIALGEEGFQAASVGEGFGDFFAAAVTGEPVLGLRYFSTKTGRQRTCANSFVVADIGGKLDKEEHAAGQVFSGTCWELRGKFQNPDDGARLVMHAIRLTPPPATFERVAIGFRVADVLLWGGSHLTVIDEVLKNRGLVPK